MALRNLKPPVFAYGFAAAIGTWQLAIRNSPPNVFVLSVYDLRIKNGISSGTQQSGLAFQNVGGSCTPSANFEYSNLLEAWVNFLPHTTSVDSDLPAPTAAIVLSHGVVVRSSH
jgi:hypothetical protein